MLTEKQKQIKEAMQTRMNSAYAFFKNAIVPTMLQMDIETLELRNTIEFYSFLGNPYPKVRVDTLIYNKKTDELWVKNSNRRTKYRLLEGLVDYVTLYDITSETLNNYGKE